MTGLHAPTALSGRSRSAADQLAKGLGWFSIGLGVLELAAARQLCRATGMDGREALVRAYGVREVATGVAILASPNPTPWIWGRVMGDALDIATVATSVRAGHPKEANAVATIGLLAGVTLVDALCASALVSEKASRHEAIADYSDRSGFPQGLAAARSVAGATGSAAERGQTRPPVTGGMNADRAADRIPDGIGDENAAMHQDELLDEALEETFPGSDPISPKHIT